MMPKDILVKNPFGNHIMLSNLISDYEKFKLSTDKNISESGPGSTSMPREEWLKATEKILKKFI